eukprot:15019836-Alexandrium_andersonii.AAC.1
MEPPRMGSPSAPQQNLKAQWRLRARSRTLRAQTEVRRLEALHSAQQAAALTARSKRTKPDDSDR